MGFVTRGLLAACATLWLAVAAAQQNYPTRPIRLIVPFPAGDSADLMARAMEPVLTERLRHPVIVENRPGAAGSAGMDAVAKSAPDGYTMGLGTAGNLAANVTFYPKLPYDPLQHLEPVSSIAFIPYLLVAPPQLPARTLEDVIALARAKPAELLIGYGGNGTAMHLSAELFKLMAKVQMVNVPYKGSAPVVADAAAGRLSLAMVDAASALASVKAGKLNAIAVSSAHRISVAPEVPTFVESGLPAYAATGWFGIVVPAKTPANIVLRLNAEIVEALKRAEVRDRILAAGAEPAPGTPSEFGALIRAEILKWAEVIRASGARPD
ncbi:MAG TPA: tripartite tricarboxylate transporter substrate binding protein [Burkholderiales bacterium]|nr:tripartite tricarboxylate transporter substrate binding protein [Burkholderiales bacterium]